MKTVGTLNEIGAKQGDFVTYTGGAFEGENDWFILKVDQPYFTIIPVGKIFIPVGKTLKHVNRTQDYEGGIGSWTFTKDMNKKPIGYVPLNEDGSIYQATLSNAYAGRNIKPTRKGVKKLYDTEGMAKRYSPVKKAKPVYF